MLRESNNLNIKIRVLLGGHRNKTPNFHKALFNKWNIILCEDQVRIDVGRSEVNASVAYLWSMSPWFHIEGVIS